MIRALAALILLATDVWLMARMSSQNPVSGTPRSETET